MWRHRVCSLVLILLAMLAVPWAQAQEPIRIVSARLDNQFPEALYFYIEVEGQARITKITLFYEMRGADSETIAPLEFDPATHVQASHRWYTRSNTVPPGVPILYHWEIADDAGNKLVTEEETFYYDDIRFSWKTLADDEVAVLWYDGGDNWGQEIYRTASLSLRELERKLAVGTEFPIRVVVYGNEADFRSAFPPIGENVGGMAFTETGMTVQIIAPGDQSYLVDAIPHEISHLLFYQLTDSPYSTPPAWLNEGLATYNEWADLSYYDNLVDRAAREGRLLPLAYIVGGFPRDDERVHLAYGQSYSLVKRLIDEYGGEKLGQYLRTFKEATVHFDDQVAFEQVYGLPLMDFVNAWRASLGADPELVPTPMPTMVPFPTPPPPGWMPTKTPMLEATAVPTPQLAPATVSPAPSPRPTLAPADGGGFIGMLVGAAVILVLVTLVIVVGVLVVARRRSP